MKAIQQHEFGAADVLQLAEVPDPTPAAGEVVVDVRAIGINPVETYIRSGIYPKPPTPFTLGNDAAGVIARVGADVGSVSVGDRVYVAGAKTGTYAEQALCTADQVHPLPERASFAQGAAINVPYVTAYQAMMHRGRAAPGETLFVHGGSGGVGIAAIQFAVALGMKVIATASTARGRELILEQRAHHALDHAAPDYLDELKSLTGGRGAHLILEMLANVNLAADIDAVARFGRIVMIGNRGERNQGEVSINPRAAMAKDADVLGMVMYNASAAEMRATHAAIVAGLAAGTLRPVIGREFPLAQAADAHRAVEAGQAYGKIVLVP
ncbi:MAG: NADPH:quinone reductase [Pseudomonadota bacterium]